MTKLFLAGGISAGIYDVILLRYDSGGEDYIQVRSEGGPISFM